MQALKRLVRKHNPQGLFLMETKCGEVKIGNVCRNLGFDHWVSVDAKGTAGGLVIMWSEDLALEIIWKKDGVICGEITDDGGLGKWRIYFCHGTPYAKEKDSFWNQLEADITTGMARGLLWEI